ncbi:hypothetical protein PR003_g5634 [Phytophthora rubi]|uniref:Uncharacterized protein n=1 Tax=Phytophthora rubi TaxID=129364 RepID=A0A6A4FPL1_9STRA|nr:hypothetical protein PR003_g5634 [Phytophthora rubi]
MGWVAVRSWRRTSWRRRAWQAQTGSVPAYIDQLLPSFKKDFVGKGKRRDKSPYFLILCSSTLDADQVPLAKLVAKHLKVDKQTNA